MTAPERLPVRARFDLVNATLDVCGPPDWAAAVYDGMLQPHDPATQASVAMTLTLRRGAPMAPDAGADLLHDGFGEDGKPVAVYNAGSVTWFIQPGLVSLKVDEASGTAEIVLIDQARMSDSFNMSMHVLDSAIALTGQTLVHAACLADLAGKTYRLIFAPSGTGKTTTTLSLAHAGHAMANDDAAVLSGTEGGGGLSVWGLARDPNVHRKTVAMLPWLDGLADWSRREERSVPLAKLADHMPISPHVRRPVGAVFSLARGAGPDAEAREIPPAEALARLVSDNVRHSAQGLGARDLAALDRLTELIRTVPAYELLVPEGADGLASAAKVFGATLAKATPHRSI
ncbi:MAG: hypothetical protein GKR99_16145 [Rhodobacteraceae bacterium]|nr:hypothetical protein [Paracoccaceae bacterium]